MQIVKSIVFRKLTDADFFHINKPAGTETGGGGQSYIDISTSAVTLNNWKEFFHGITPFQRSGRIGWKVPIHSLGTKTPAQEITIAERRDTSVSIREQKLSSRESNRVYAWHPDYTDFPKPTNPSEKEHIYDLRIYIVKLENGEYWAGWLNRSRPEPNWSVNKDLNEIFLKDEGYIKFNGNTLFEEADSEWSFRIAPATATQITDPIVPTTELERKIDDRILFDEDEGETENNPPVIKEVVRKIRIRNTKAVKQLKQLYGNKCQISGEIYTFQKKDGELYSEAHHLIPLGEGGADSAHNIVILSPLLHRMLHNAKVENLDLRNIKDNKLTIKINGKDYTITWHPDHAKIVEQFNQ
ncbi:HNH endonuclease [Candidatus Micrarchaeota archaeon]|nr:HNH endonuclease [Candidatus Micrarchaeota archaeon]